MLGVSFCPHKQVNMVLDINEMDECGTGRESPPSYYSSLRQEAGLNTQTSFAAFNLDTLNNRNWKKCLLCQCCHKERLIHSNQTTKSLNSLVNIIESHAATYEAHYITTVCCVVWLFLFYLLYVWVYYTPSPTIIDEQFQRAFANANISDDVQEILLEGAKRRMVEDFKKCILSKL